VSLRETQQGDDDERLADVVFGLTKEVMGERDRLRAEVEGSQSDDRDQGRQDGTLMKRPRRAELRAQEVVAQVAG
jgi:hypothetical protein